MNVSLILAYCVGGMLVGCGATALLYAWFMHREFRCHCRRRDVRAPVIACVFTVTSLVRAVWGTHLLVLHRCREVWEAERRDELNEAQERARRDRETIASLREELHSLTDRSTS